MRHAARHLPGHSERRRAFSQTLGISGNQIGIKEVDEAIWLVSFMANDLGHIDLEQKTLQPLDNPFGPLVSPMS